MYPCLVSFFLSIYLFYIVTVFFFAYNVFNKKYTKIKTLALISSITITKVDSIVFLQMFLLDLRSFIMVIKDV